MKGVKVATVDESDSGSPMEHPAVTGHGPDGDHQDISFRPLVRALWVVLAALVVVGLASTILNNVVPDRDGPVRGSLEIFARWFELDAENDVPTWFSIMILAGVALGFGTIAAVLTSSGRPSGHYRLFCLVALYLCLDEGASVHEELGRITQQLVSEESLPTFAWILPGLAIAVVVGVVVLRLARAIPTRLRLRLVVAGAVYLLGSVAIEAVSGLLFTADDDGGGSQTPAYLVVSGLEEATEMAGVLLALGAVLGVLRLRRRADGLQVGVAPDV